jgi:hypothetical protein
MGAGCPMLFRFRCTGLAGNPQRLECPRWCMFSVGSVGGGGTLLHSRVRACLRAGLRRQGARMLQLGVAEPTGDGM